MMEPLRELSLSKFNQHPSSRGLINFAYAETATDNRNYYDILGVKKDATKHEIHRAFRQMAKKYHPDKNKEEGAQDEFIKIFKAYETLSDEKKRKEYDEQANGQRQQFHNSNHWQQSSQHMSDFDMNEFFRQYQDQFMRHAQHFNHHHQQHFGQHNSHHHYHHDKFTFHGVNLDDLFHDIDEDEFSSFGRLFEMTNGNNHNHFQHHQEAMDGTFGDGASYFGSHFAASHLHDNHMNQFHGHQHQYHQANSPGGMHCHTITRQVNGMMMTQTSCS